MAEVQLDHVTKVFQGRSGEGRVLAVNDATFTVPDGEFVVLVGPSGCGKTTTLRLIAGLEKDFDGNIYIGDRLVNKLHPKERDIAMVFQDYALYPHMTVYENLSFGLENLRVPTAEIESKVNQTSQMLGIGDLLDRRPRQLSGGQRQRVAVGRAIVRSPKVFLFDEPLSNLDAKLRVQMRVELAELHQQLGTTMIYVTHDQVEAMTLGSQIVVMNYGIIQQMGDPRTVYEQPANLFVAGFLGSPPMNFFSGKCVRNEGSKFVGDDVVIDLPHDIMERYRLRDGQGLILGIRPEDFRVIDEGALSQSVPGQIEAKIRVIEFLGSETLIYFDLGGQVRTASVEAQTMKRQGGKVFLQCDFERACFFDPVTEASLVRT